MNGQAALANPKHENYAKHRANGFIPKKAALAAGYASGSAIYTELETDPDITARVQVLIDERMARKEALRIAAAEAGRQAGELSGVSHGWVISQLRSVSEQALEAGDFKEAKESAVKIGEHLGMFGKSGGEGTGSGSNGDGPAVIDMDIVDRLTQQTDHLQPAKAQAKAVDPDLVQSLIEGQGTLGRSEPSNRLKTGARQLQTGSETDVAMTMDDDEADD